MEFVTNLFASRPELYQKAMVSTFFPHLAYLIRLKDPKIVMGMAWRPHFLSYESWSGFSWKVGMPIFFRLSTILIIHIFSSLVYCRVVTFRTSPVSMHSFITAWRCWETSCSGGASTSGSGTLSGSPASWSTRTCSPRSTCTYVNTPLPVVALSVRSFWELAVLQSCRDGARGGCEWWRGR